MCVINASDKRILYYDGHYYLKTLFYSQYIMLVYGLMIINLKCTESLEWFRLEHYSWIASVNIIVFEKCDGQTHFKSFHHQPQLTQETLKGICHRCSSLIFFFQVPQPQKIIKEIQVTVYFMLGGLTFWFTDGIICNII